MRFYFDPLMVTTADFPWLWVLLYFSTRWRCFGWYSKMMAMMMMMTMGNDEQPRFWLNTHKTIREDYFLYLHFTFLLWDYFPFCPGTPKLIGGPSNVTIVVKLLEYKLGTLLYSLHASNYRQLISISITLSICLFNHATIYIPLSIHPFTPSSFQFIYIVWGAFFCIDCL